MNWGSAEGIVDEGEAFRYLCSYVDSTIAGFADVQASRDDDSVLRTLYVAPVNPLAVDFSLLMADSIMLFVGGTGAFWELGYDVLGVARAKEVIDAVINGRCTGRYWFAFASITIEFKDGTTERNGAMVLPMLPWIYPTFNRRWRGHRVRFEPYLPSNRAKQE